MATAISPTQQTVAVFNRIAADVSACAWAWEPRASFTKKAIRVTSGASTCLIDIHPKVDGHDWVFGGAYLRGVENSGVTITDATPSASRTTIADHITATFPDEIADAVAHADDGSIASTATSWRSGGGGSGASGSGEGKKQTKEKS